MNYPQVSADTAAEELNRLHGEIENKMRSTVQDAIRAGEILAKVKEQLSHGNFLPWVQLNCRFAERTAYNYMGLYAHSNKIATVANLQEAYKQVEVLEAQAGMSETQRAWERVRTYIKTGEKPEGWRRGTDDKMVKEETDRAARIAKMQQELKEEHEQNQKSRSDNEDNAKKLFGEGGIFEKAIKQLTHETVKKQEFMESIRISHEGKDDPFVAAIMDYLNGLTDNSRRIEACYNIIKVCKGIANDLQRGVS
jgi:hypothetical protein